MYRPRDIRRRFDRAAATFDDADFVHAVTRDGLLSRLEPLRVDPRRILDLGAATGATGRRLRARFRRAQIVSLDLSLEMARRARASTHLFARPRVVQADAARLPFADASFDLVVANQLLPWLSEPQAAFAEVERVVVEGGVFAFATLGPDSLRELRDAWASADTREEHVHRFADMHDVGDDLVRAGLADPVLDVDRLTISYDDIDRLFADLTRSGARNALAGRARGLTGRRRFAAMKAALANCARGDRITFELEIVYGHCWGRGRPGDHRVAADGITVRDRRR